MSQIGIRKYLLVSKAPCLVYFVLSIILSVVMFWIVTGSDLTTIKTQHTAMVSIQPSPNSSIAGKINGNLYQAEESEYVISPPSDQIILAQKIAKSTQGTVYCPSHSCSASCINFQKKGLVPVWCDISKNKTILEFLKIDKLDLTVTILFCKNAPRPLHSLEDNSMVQKSTSVTSINSSLEQQIDSKSKQTEMVRLQTSYFYQCTESIFGFQKCTEKLKNQKLTQLTSSEAQYMTYSYVKQDRVKQQVYGFNIRVTANAELAKTSFSGIMIAFGMTWIVLMILHGFIEWFYLVFVLNDRDGFNKVKVIQLDISRHIKSE